MNDSTDKEDRVTELRRKAEEKVASQPTASVEIDAKRLLHELQVHQVELELQNEELRQTQEKLVESRDRYSDLYDFAPVGYVTFDGKGSITSANLAVASLLGVERSQLIGQWFGQFLVSDGRQAFTEFLAKTFASSCKQSCELLLSIAERGDRFVQVEASAVDAGESCRAAIVDINERKEYELALIRAREAADIANQVKSQFLANMSHEIRTPITGILGFSELLKGTELSELQHNFLESIFASADDLLTLVNDFLDLSKVEAGLMSLERREFSLRKMADELFRSLILHARAKGLSIKTDVSKAVPDHLVGDPFRVKQILLILLDNAIKFTKQGSVEIAVNVEQQQNLSALLRFDVTDTGPGIKPEDLSRIFEPFNQVDSSMTRNFGGAGLGLAICMQLSQLMGGDVWVDSRVGVGSTFHVRIPFTVAQNSPELGGLRKVHQEDEWQGRPLRILLAEDNETSQRLFDEALKNCGHHVDVVENGSMAYEKWSQSDYDIILLDLQMPVMDGKEAVRKIRARECDSGGHVVIIALTAHAMEEHRREVLSQGFDGYVSKPTRIKDLFSEMMRCLSENDSFKNDHF